MTLPSHSHLSADGIRVTQHQSANFWDCSDPYVEVGCGRASFKTKVVDNNLNPEFNETFTFTAGPADQLSIKVNAPRPCHLRHFVRKTI